MTTATRTSHWPRSSRCPPPSRPIRAWRRSVPGQQQGPLVEQFPGRDEHDDLPAPREFGDGSGDPDHRLARPGDGLDHAPAPTTPPRVQRLDLPLVESTRRVGRGGGVVNQRPGGSPDHGPITARNWVGSHGPRPAGRTGRITCGRPPSGRVAGRRPEIGGDGAGTRATRRRSSSIPGRRHEAHRGLR